MDMVLNTIETMLVTSAERDRDGSALIAAAQTTASILASMSDEQLEALTDELDIRKGWCGRMVQHEARNLVTAAIRLTQATRRLARAGKEHTR